MNLSVLAQFLPQKAAIRGLRAVMKAKGIIKYRDPYFFQQVFIEINRHCNRACAYCPNVSTPSQEWFMSLRQFSVIIDRLKEIKWGGPVGYHCLSEPLLHPELEQFIRYTGFHLPSAIPVLFTNGDFLTADRAATLIGAGLQRCTITNHPPLKPGWLERIDAICQQWPNIFRYQRLGADVIMKSGSWTKIRHRPKPSCRSPELMLAVRWNGDYGLCHCDPKGDHTFGNANATGILEAWNRPSWKEIRKRLRQGYRDYAVCKDCDGVV